MAATYVGHCVALSQGKLCMLKVYRKGWITMWLLKDEED